MRPQVKDGMSSFDIGAVVREVSPLLVDRIVNNIYQINSHTLLLSFQGLQERLLIEAGRRLHLTAYRHDLPRTPPPFCRALRKYLRRIRLTDLVQIDFDRVVKLTFSSMKGEFSLFSELFGKGNHVLVDEEGRVLHALTYRRMKDRDILKRAVLRLPPSTRKNILQAERSDVEGLLTKSGPLATQLTRIFNIGGIYAEELALRAGLDSRMICETLSEQEIELLYNAVQSLVASYERVEPHIVLNEEGTYFTVLPFPLKSFEDYEIVRFPSFSRAVDQYYMKLQVRATVSTVSSRFQERLEEQRRILAEQRAQMTRLEQSIQTNQKVGDIIYAHTLKLQKLLNQLMESRKAGKPWNQIISELADLLPTLPVTIEPTSGTASVELNGIRFKLDIRKTVYENAALFYKRAKTSKAKLEGLKNALNETYNRIEALRHAKPEPQEEEVTPLKARKRAWYEKYRWFHSSDNYLILGGRDATTNEILIKHHTDPTDIVLHAEIPGSPFAVIKSEGKTPSETTIQEAAEMVASYSKAWRSGVSATDVYWVKPEQVSKSPPSGEYLPKGSFMIYGSRNYLKNVPLKLAIGVKETPERLIVIGGPPSAIASKTPLFLEIIPGRRKTGELIKRIVSKLIKKAPGRLKKEIKRLPLNEFQTFIPGGGGELAINSAP